MLFQGLDNQKPSSNSSGRSLFVLCHSENFRIVPPYAAYITLCLLAIRLLRADQQFGEIPYLATFSYNWRMIFTSQPQFAAFGHLWTISVEEQFYLLFPILILLLRRDRAIFGLVAIICLAPVVRNVMAVQLATHLWDAGRIAFGVYASSFGQLMRSPLERYLLISKATCNVIP